MLVSYECFGVGAAARQKIAFLALPFSQRRVSARLAFLLHDRLTAFSWSPCFVS